MNNVGRMYDYPDELGKVPTDLLWHIININIGAVTMMTRMLVNDMKKRGKGAIVNISSGSELQPLPYMAVYSASKVTSRVTVSVPSNTDCDIRCDFVSFQIYVKNFTLAIQRELAPYGVSVQLVTPMYVRTKMNNYSTTVMAGSILIPDAESYTKSAVFCLGKTNETTGYWTHGIQVRTRSRFPEEKNSGRKIDSIPESCRFSHFAVCVGAAGSDVGAHNNRRQDK